MTSIRSALGLFVPVFLVSTSTARAGIFVPMVPLGRHEVISKNGAFVLDVNPDAERNTIYFADDRTRPLWSFKGVLKTDVKKILLADDGSVVALIGGSEMDDGTLKRGEGVRLIDRTGATRSHDYEDFNRASTFSYGCGGNAALWFDEVIDHGDRFVIQTRDGKEHTFGYTTAAPARRWLRAAAVTAVMGVILVVLFVRTGIRRPGDVPAVEEAS